MSQQPAVMREAIAFPSYDGRTTINAKAWFSEAALQGGVRGIVQLVHGMTEHIERYDHFATYLVNCGYAVFAHDHIGHGKSVVTQDDWGFLPAKTGARVLVEDVHSLRGLACAFARERFGVEAPAYVLFGHSMGSFVVRSYLARYGEGLAAAIICGTGNQPLVLSRAGNALARLLCAVRGERSYSNLIHGMADGAYAKKIPNAQTKLDWLSYERSNVERYLEDPACGFMFTVGGYATLTDLTGEVVQPSCAAKIPPDLPLLYIAGIEDPVGDCGEGVRAAAKLAEDAGVKDVTCVLYENMRHEVLNECEKEKVYEDVRTWIDARVARAES